MDRQETTKLLDRARGGSAEALNELFERCSRRLLALIRLRLGPELRAHTESRDILQASLLKSFQGFDRFEASGSASLMAWLARIAENEIRDRADYHRRQRRDVRATVGLDEAGELADRTLRSLLSHLVLDEESERLEQALESLSPEHREVILLRKYEERSWGEIASRMERSADACRMLLARAMAALTLAVEEAR